MAFVKYIELHSYYRNRFQWPNPFKFSVTSINNQSNYYDDPVCKSAPIVVFVPLPRIIPVTIQLLKDGWNTCLGNFNPTLHAYRGTSISGITITESVTLPNLLLFKTDVALPQAPMFIDTKTDLPNGILHLPGMSVRDDLYTGWTIANDTLGTHTPVLKYISHCLFFKPMPGWAITHTFSLRKENEIIRRRITTLDSNKVQFSQPMKQSDENSFVRVISSNTFARILRIENDKGEVSPLMTNLDGERCEIIPVSWDNDHPFNFVNYGRVYMMQLLGLTIPNIKLKNNVKLFDLDAICVDVLINNFSRDNIYSTNNPHIIKTCFVVNVSRFITEENKQNAFVYINATDTPAIETNMCDISEIRISCMDLHGNPLEPLEPDYMGPLMPNPDMQVRLSIKLVST